MGSSIDSSGSPTSSGTPGTPGAPGAPGAPRTPGNPDGSRASPSAPPGLWFGPARANQRDQALSILLTGQADGRKATVEHFLGFSAEQNLDLSRLWVATSANSQPGATILAAALVVVCAGRTGMIFLSPQLRSHHGAAAELVRRITQAMRSESVSLVQALLDDHQFSEQQVLEAAGYRRLARLIYMQRQAERTTTDLVLEPGMRVEHYAPAARPLFARAILASYEQTLDCPDLLGVRQIDDIIDGHMSTGKFVPELWSALYHAEEPVGVMLLNPLPPRKSLELVYLGISQRWRGKGWARRLLQHGLGLARQHGAEEMILAVDDQNGPAMQLYRGLGFAATTRKLALIHTF